VIRLVFDRKLKYESAQKSNCSIWLFVQKLKSADNGRQEVGISAAFLVSCRVTYEYE